MSFGFAPEEKNAKSYQYDIVIHRLHACRRNLDEGMYDGMWATCMELTFDGQALSRKGLYPHFPCLQIIFSRSGRTSFSLFGVLHFPFA